jgi:primosomal protein N' (replication factor Y)
MTLHRGNNAMLCHYCGSAAVPPTFCPKCSSKEVASNEQDKKELDAKNPTGQLALRGGGTERIFEELQEIFPNAIIDRLDRDSVTSIDHYRAVLDRLRSQVTQILVGTQMIAKGHDLPGVTLVGVADCDVGLHMPDFRASERVFQLLTQVAGRAGRAGKDGVVVLQTRVPKHLSIVASITRSYNLFAEREIAARKDKNYPPFCRLLRIVASSPEQNEPLDFLTRLNDLAKSVIAQQKFQIAIYGPSPAPLRKLKTLWRAQLLLKSSSGSALNLLMQILKASARAPRELRVVYDIDPQEMM